jgi:hypothetical protein
LSAFFTISAKLGSSIETARNTVAAAAMIQAAFGFQSAFERSARKNSSVATLMKSLGSVSVLMPPLRASTMTIAAYTGPEMPPSLRTRQKCTAIRIPAISGIPTQCST